MTEFHEDLEWDETLADDTPLASIQLSAKWRDYLLGVVSVLKQRELWSTDTNWLLLEQQLCEIERRLMGDEAFDMEFSPNPMSINPLSCYYNAAANWTWGACQELWYEQRFMYTDFVSNEIKLLHFEVYLPKGVYEFRIYSDRNPDRGKYRWKLFGPENIDGSIKDLYQAAFENTWDNTPIAVNLGGYYRCELWRMGKNPLSTGACIWLGAMTVKKTS